MSLDHDSSVETSEKEYFKWERPHFYLEGELFIPKIYKGNDQPSEEFNTFILTVDATLSSTLDWKEERKKAALLGPNKKILWKIELGLFSQLSYSLSKEMQFQSFCLVLKHFRDTLWQEFKHLSLGVILYEGRLDFKRGFVWDDKQEANLQEWITQHQLLTPLNQDQMRLYCRDACSEYLQLLQDQLSDAVPCFLLFDAQGINETLTFAQLISSERWNRFHLCLKKPPFPSHHLAWDHPYSNSGYIASKPLLLETFKTHIGVCLPSADLIQSAHFVGLKQVFDTLISKKLNFRLISESFLTAEWEEIDYLIYCAEGTSPQGKRKLQGFCAAGGIPVYSSQIGLGLNDEISFDAFSLIHKTC